MTVGKRLKTTRATLEGLAADFKTSALESDDPGTRQMFEKFYRDLQPVLKSVEERIKEIEIQEPQYKE